LFKKIKLIIETLFITDIFPLTGK